MSTRIRKKLRDALLDRDKYLCQRCGRHVLVIGYSLQHRRPKQMGGSKLLDTMPNLVTMCGDATDPRGCHAWAESNRLEAQAFGWLVPHGVTPDEWRVWRFGRSWQQPGDGWVVAEPHPRQVELVAEWIGGAA